MKLERKATITSLSVAFILTLLKLFVGIFSSSVAVLSSAIDSLLDFFVSVFNYIAVKNADKEVDENFNYGRGKIEAIASFLEGIIISLSGFFILYKSVLKFATKEELTQVSSSIIVMIISVIFTGFLVAYLDKVYKKTKNIVIKADSLHYKTDLYTNMGILFSLVIIYFTKLYFIDAIVGIIISIYIIYSAYKITKEGFLLLLDIALPKKEVKQIEKILKSCKNITDFHYLKTRSSGKYKFISVHLVFTKDIKLLDAHDTSDRIEAKIRKLDKKSTWVINIHLDPYDDSKYCILEPKKNHNNCCSTKKDMKEKK